MASQRDHRSHLNPGALLETTRAYIEKGEAPLFFEIELAGAQAHDRVEGAHRSAVTELVTRNATLIVPIGNREGIRELVELARDEDQSFYRVLYLEDQGRVRACVGFGAVSGCHKTYDCYGLAAEGEAWAAKGLEALVKWMGKAKARMVRFEIDEANDAVARLALERGFREEGRMDDFYADGAGQLILMWRPDGQTG